MNSPRLKFRVFPHVLVVAGLVMLGGAVPIAIRAQDVAQSTSGPDSRARLEQLLARQVSVQIKDASVSDAIQKIAEAGKVRVLFREDLVDQTPQRLTLTLSKVSLGDALNRVLAGKQMTIALGASNTIVIRASSTRHDASDTTAPASTGEIRGRVIDSATKKYVPGATIQIQGRKERVVTGEEGEFYFPNIPVGEHLVSAKLLGYRSGMQRVTVQAQKRSAVVISLAAAATSLSEVVTTATGTQRKVSIGNDITTINVDSVMKKAPITKVTDLLEGRVPGLTVIRSSGVPGAPSRIRLRGIGGGLMADSLGGATNDPIVIVDGIRIYASQSGRQDQNLAPAHKSMSGQYEYSSSYPSPSPLDQIDPNSIETIEVFKGPSATAMYGSDAANGVIVIKTKQGQAGSTRWTMTGSRGIEYMPGRYAAPGYYRFGHRPMGSINSPTTCIGLSNLELWGDCVVDSVVRFQALNDPRLSVIGRGYNDALSATVGGGTRAFTYSITGSIGNALGMTKMPPLYQDLYRVLYDSAPAKWMRRPNKLDQKGVSATFATDLTPQLRATFTTALSNTTQRQSSANLQLSTLMSQYIDTLNIPAEDIGGYATRIMSRNTTINNALSLIWNGWAFLPLQGTFGINRNERDDDKFIPQGIVQKGTSSGSISSGYFSTGKATRTTGTARVVGTLFPSWRVATAMGVEMTKLSTVGIQASIDTLLPGVSRPTTLATVQQSGRSTATGGWFLEPRINFNSRFFVNPGFRIDGNSASGRRSGINGGLWSLFPKMNFSWIALNREGDAPMWGVLTLLRPRLSFGVAGVQPAAEWNLRLMEPWKTTVGAVSDQGLVLRTIGNTQLRPERTREIEGGFDVQLWGTRLSATFTQFYKMRYDAIETLPVAASLGTSLQQFRNIGQVRNSGTEVTVSAVVIDYPTISWQVNASLSRYTNVLKKLESESEYINVGRGTRLVQGYPLFGRWSRPILGWRPPSADGRLAPSDIIVADSAVYVGMQAPDFEFPFSTNVSLFRGLVSFSAMFQYKSGMTQNNIGQQGLLDNLVNNPNASLTQQAAALAAGCFDPNSISISQGGKPCTDYGLIQTVNSLRFNSVSIGYNVPREYLRRLPFSTASIALQGSNLGLWTNYRGKDPDVNGLTVGDATSDTGQIPSPRTWRLQIRLGN